jgi:hypothetical protein
MAFASNAVQSAPSNTSNENWKAQGFLNFYLPSKNGQRRKLGAIPLKETKVNEKQLLAWLNEDPSRVAQILSKLELEYQSAAANDEHAFDLG